MLTHRSNAELALLWQWLGTDLALDFGGPAGAFEDGDLATHVRGTRGSATVDVGVVSAVTAAEQLLVNRIKTQRGELAPLGHPDYGSRHHELIGQPNIERNRNLIKLYVLEALGAEPRVQKILACRVVPTTQPPRDQVRVEIDVLLIGLPHPLNLVVPFSFGTPLGTGVRP